MPGFSLPHRPRRRPARGEHPRRRFLARVPGVLAILYTALVALTVLATLLPGIPFVGLLDLVSSFWTVNVLAASLIAAVFGLIMAWFGARRTGRVMTACGLLCAVGAMVPLVSLMRLAAKEDIPVSLWQNAHTGGDHGKPNRAASVRVNLRGSSRMPIQIAPAAGRSVADRPAVLWVHGGGWSSGSQGATPKLTDFFNGQGFVVFDVAYRLTPPPRWSDAARDVACAAAWVRRNAGRYGVDRDKVIFAGESSGAQLALQVGLTAAQKGAEPLCPGATALKPAALIGLYAPTDPAMAWDPRQDLPWGIGYAKGLLEDHVGGTPATVPERFREIAPVTHVTADSAPTLLLQGANDHVVPEQQTRRLAAVLAGAGVEHRSVVMPYTDHAFITYPGSLAAQIARGEMARWMRRWAPVPAPPPHPKEAAAQPGLSGPSPADDRIPTKRP